MEFLWNIETPVAKIPRVFPSASPRGNPRRPKPPKNPPILASPKIHPTFERVPKRPRNRGNRALRSRFPVRVRSSAPTRGPTRGPTHTQQCSPTRIPTYTRTCTRTCTTARAPTRGPTHTRTRARTRARTSRPTRIPTHTPPTGFLGRAWANPSHPQAQPQAQPQGLRRLGTPRLGVRRLGVRRCTRVRRVRPGIATRSTATSSGSGPTGPGDRLWVGVEGGGESRLVRGAGRGPTRLRERDPAGLQTTRAATASR